ncbi:hypothetical protein [Clostridium sp. AF21-20LB]|uniref:hypothetical protein n=1 Tax=unclassified Clostridium TaxID=2614128 RepID=UPI0026D967C9
MRKNSGMWKTISRKEKLRRVLLIIFGAGVIALAGVSYQYVKNAVPDRINVVVDRQEQVRFGLPFRALLESESEEVLLNGSSKFRPTRSICSSTSPFPSILNRRERTV